MNEYELMSERIKELRAENADLEQRLANLDAYCNECEVMIRSLRAQLKGFREGVAIGMEYTRKELAFYRALVGAAIPPPRPRLEEYSPGEAIARGGERMK